MKQRLAQYTTRDLLMMAALAALGGATSTYINAVGDFFQSILGFAGTTQWAAGLHVIWLTLAVGLTRKQGAGTITGMLKGGVELLTGNTHGLLVVLVDVVAGLLVDIGFLPFRKKDSLAAFCLAGGLASASNVFVFQLFASVPADSLAYWAILLVGGVALLSGIVFGGVLSRWLLTILRRTGVVKDALPEPVRYRLYPVFLLGVVLITSGLTIYLRGALRGPETIRIRGAVDVPFLYPEQNSDFIHTTAEGTLHEVTAKYDGIPVRELLAHAQPQSNASLLLIRAKDGYAFFVSMDEVYDNNNLLLSSQGEGDDISFNIVGAMNPKAWVRGVEEFVVVGETSLEICGALDNPDAYNPDEWQFDMDSTRVDLSSGGRKLQGVSLGKVLASMIPQDRATLVTVYSRDEENTLPLANVLNDDDWRLFTVIESDGVTYTFARMDGQVLVENVTRIEVK